MPASCSVIWPLGLRMRRYLGNIFILMGLFVFTYAVLGVALFANVTQEGPSALCSPTLELANIKFAGRIMRFSATNPRSR